MKRRSPEYLPTHFQLFFNRLTNWFAVGFLVIVIPFLLISWFVVGRIFYSIDRDCTNTYNRDIKHSHYWIKIQVGSTAEGCPVYESR